MCCQAGEGMQESKGDICFKFKYILAQESESDRRWMTIVSNFARTDKIKHFNHFLFFFMQKNIHLPLTESFPEAAVFQGERAWVSHGGGAKEYIFS